MILAAGEGTRLWPFTETRSKCTVPVLDRPLIHYVLDVVAHFTRKVCVVVGKHKEDVERVVREYGVRVLFVEQKERKGTGHALLQAEKHVTDDFLVVYGDILITKKILMPPLSILAVKLEHRGEYGSLVIKNGVVVDIREKKPGNLVNGGVYRLTQDVFSLLDTVSSSPREELELTNALKQMGLRPYFLDAESWMDVGRPWDILEANRRVLENVNGGIEGDVEEGARIKGKVIVKEGAEIRAGSYVVGPVYIGENATVGPNCYIRPATVVGRNARVGNAVEIKNSVLFPHAHVSHLSYVGDSVLGEGVNFGAGTITANLRFDDKEVRKSGRRKLGAFVGDHVKTGVNVSLMPGVCIGPYSWIAPGMVVYRDVPSRTFLK